MGYLLSQRADSARVHPHIMLPIPSGEKDRKQNVRKPRTKERSCGKKHREEVRGGGFGGGLESVWITLKS